MVSIIQDQGNKNSRFKTFECPTCGFKWGIARVLLSNRNIFDTFCMGCQKPHRIDQIDNTIKEVKNLWFDNEY